MASFEKLTTEERLKLDPLVWWKKNAAVLPYTSYVARSILCVQASSAASERLFSAAGFIE